MFYTYSCTGRITGMYKAMRMHLFDRYIDTSDSVEVLAVCGASCVMPRYRRSYHVLGDNAAYIATREGTVAFLPWHEY